VNSRKPLAIIFAVVFLDLLGFGIVIPQLGIYAHRFGGSGFLVGCLASMYSAMQFLFAPFFGRLSDRVGRRPVLLISILGSVAGYLIFGFAGSLFWLFVGRTVQGVSGANIGTAQAYISDVTPPEDRAKSLGMYLGAAFGLGFIFGPALGGALSQWGNLGLGVVAAVMSALSFLVALFFLPESLPPEKRGVVKTRKLFDLSATLEVMRLPDVGRTIAVFAIATLAFSMMEGVFSLYVLVRFFGGAASAIASTSTTALAESAGRWTAAIFVTIGVVSTIVQGGLIGTLRARYTESRLVVFGLGAEAVAFLGTTLAPTLLLLFPSMGLLALGSGVNNPSISSLISQLAPRERQGEVIGVFQSMGSLSRTIGPALGGLVFQLLGMNMPFAGAAFLMGVATLLALRLTASAPAASSEAGP
jgi:DHA1 family tetracycline resistance protein-like MFS transporter